MANRPRLSQPTDSSKSPAKRGRIIVAATPALAPATQSMFPIVGIGASAGGLEACSQLLRKLPIDSGVAIVIVQHLAPDHASVMAGLLAGTTKLPVVEVTEGMTVEPNHVYVVPPNVQMGISGGKLNLTPRPDDRTQYMPIDFFFRTLADDVQSRAIGVVLSGTASDGAAGLGEIKGAGGITFAQDPATAKYDGMPRSAIAIGAVDLVLSPESIAVELARIGRHPTEHLPVPQDGVESVPGGDQLRKIFHLLRNNSGVDFTHYKLPTIRRRLQRRMLLHKVTGLVAYERLLQQNPAEVSALYNDILIHVTRFFRDSESFVTLTTRVFPKLLAQRRGDAPIRIWVPGCSTGEEAYSIGIALLEFLGDKRLGTSIQIFATDVSETAVEQARSGTYPENISADVSAERLRRYFVKMDGHYRIAKSVRDLCVFARQDLTRDPPFSKLDLIACRNVLIYLGPVLQKKLMSVFHYALKPGGVLMLGSAESIGPHTDLFAVVDKRHKLYTRKMAVVRADMSFGTARSDERNDGHDEGSPRPPASPRAAPPDPPPAPDLHEQASRAILSRYSPPGVIVDSDYRIIQFRGQTGAYLEPAPGEASLSVLKMAREGILHGLRSALLEAKREGETVRKDGLRVRNGRTTRGVGLTVIPLTSSQGSHFLILFIEDPVDRIELSERKTPGKVKNKPRAGVAGREDRRVERLEHELAASREYLQSNIQDLEAANEELQSANEEVLSSNEELQSTNEELDTAKEELQSTNEELNTVNDELQGRNEELSRVNSDLINLLGSVQIAIVMVSGDLRIRRFTPMAEKVLNLIPGDIGRPIGDIKPNIDCPELESLILEAIDSVSVKEKEVRDRNGNWMSLRIRPYKSLDNRIDGAVLALLDGDPIGRHRHELKSAIDSGNAARGQLGITQEILQAIRQPLLVLDAKYVIRMANKSFLTAFATNAPQVMGSPFFDQCNGRWDIPELRASLAEVISRGTDLDDFEVSCDFPDGGTTRLLLNAHRIAQPKGDESLILLSIEVVSSH